MSQPMQNYSAHAITNLLAFANKMRRANHPDAEHVESLANDIRGAHKFSVPYEGQLLQDRTAINQPLVMTRLPHSSIAIETNMRMPEGIGNITAITPRVILAQEVVFDKETSEVTTPGLFMAPNAIRIDMAALMDKRYGWMPRPCGVIIMIGDSSEIVEEDETDEAGNKLLAQIDFTVVTYPRLVHTSQTVRDETSEGDFADKMANYVEYEIRVVAELLAALSCQNVTTVAEQPAEKLNKARIKSGKEPFFETHSLAIKSDKSSEPVSLCRGAIQRSQSGTKTWIHHQEQA